MWLALVGPQPQGHLGLWPAALFQQCSAIRTAGDQALSAGAVALAAEQLHDGCSAMAAIIGRREELAEVGRFLEALHRAPGALVFEGEAGIGKTRVWEESVGIAADA